MSPLAAIAITAGALALLLLAAGSRTSSVFLGGLFVLLTGYAFMGRGFAHIGVSPFFVGELVLSLGLFAVVTARPARRLGLAELLVVAFMVWGAIRTVPYIETYGFDAMRDAALWGYAAFAVIISLVIRKEHISRLLTLYRRLIPLFVMWVPILAVAWLAYRYALPQVPGSTVEIPYLKAGDMAVHLAGVAAFILTGLYGVVSWRRLSEPLIWLLWLGGFAATSALNRGGMLAVMVATPTVFLFVRSLSRWVIVVLTTLTLLGTLTLMNVEVETGGRSISVAQLTDNIASIIGDTEDPELAGTGLVGTRQWREDWWSMVIDYTIGGPYFWGGKGYGVDLALDDGFKGTWFDLRAPHNAHISVLARSGVPGLALWLAVLAAFTITVLRAAYFAARSGHRRWAAVLAWIFAYWLAALVNMSFDVYLEGPQGGILFWSLFGLGLAAAACARETMYSTPPGSTV